MTGKQREISASVSASAILFALASFSCCDSIVWQPLGKPSRIFSAPPISEIDGARSGISRYTTSAFSPGPRCGTLGLGESYMDGWWDCEALDEMCCRAIRARLEERFTYSLRNLLALATSFVINRQTRRRARRVGEVHYIWGMISSRPCSIPGCNIPVRLRGGDDLATAQQRKLEMTCQRLQLRPGLRLLDIGCGWGGLAKYAAENYGCSVVGLTISREQQEFAAEWCRGLDVQIQLRDYREVRGTSTVRSASGWSSTSALRIIALICARLRIVRENGRFLCQGICNPVSSFQLDPWIRRYIFPNSVLPSLSRLTKAGEGLFPVEDVRNFGPHYDPTLLAWEENFRRAWPRFAEPSTNAFSGCGAFIC